ncbi:MAG: GerMN domain-containing protein [Candidatus Caldatribacteriaceae bacterium]
MEKVERKKWRSKRKKRGAWTPFWYILLGVVLFFGVVYGGEFLFRLLSPRETTPPSTPFSRETPSPERTPAPTVLSQGGQEVILYFANTEFTALVGEKRKINVGNNQLKAVLQELLRGPQNKSLFNPIPPDTRLNEVFQEKEVVYVDLSAEMMRNQSGGTSQELLSVYAIVNTITTLPGIKRVKILIDGREEPTLCGHIDVSQPLERDEKLIAQVR